MTKERICAYTRTLSEAARLEIRDQLVLALDEIETGPLDEQSIGNVALSLTAVQCCMRAST